MRGGKGTGDERSFVEKAREGWGQVPDWVAALAARADALGLRGAAKVLGRSRSYVSCLISNSYAGDMGRAEELVRGALLGATVECPGVGGQPMKRNTCLEWQAKPFAPTSSQRMKMYRACRGGCPHFLRQKEEAADAV